MPKPPLQIDSLDRKLLDLLQHNAAQPLHEIGNAIGLSASAVQRRIARYKSAGLIAREIAVLDAAAVPGIVLACVFVTLERESTALHRRFQQRLAAAPEVQQCYGLAGDWDYLVILAVDGMLRCRAIIDELFLDAPNVKRYDTRFVFEAVKVGLQIPLDRRS